MVPAEKGVGESDVKFWNGASEASGKTTTLPEGIKAGAEKDVGIEKDAEEFSVAF
jgi:hypothetical protein